MTKSLRVHRDELGLDPLEVQDPTGGFYVIGTPLFGPFGVDSTYGATVPWVDGERITHTRRSNGTYVVEVAVNGESEDDLLDLTDELVEAFQQIEFWVEWRLATKVRWYRCLNAAPSPASDTGALSEIWYRQHTQNWRLTGGHRPMARSVN